MSRLKRHKDSRYFKKLGRNWSTERVRKHRYIELDCESKLWKIFATGERQFQLRTFLDPAETNVIANHLGWLDSGGYIEIIPRCLELEEGL